MPVKIRLQRHGKKGKPFYWIVAADSRAKRDGKFLEKLGIYNPNTNPATIEINVDQSVQWLQNGAQPTHTAKRILSYKGVLLKHHLLGGVAKGALTEEEVTKKFDAWVKEKEAAIAKKESTLEKEAEKARAKALEAEKEANEKRALAAIEAENLAEEEVEGTIPPAEEALQTEEATAEEAPATAAADVPETSENVDASTEVENLENAPEPEADIAVAEDSPAVTEVEEPKTEEAAATTAEDPTEATEEAKAEEE